MRERENLWRVHSIGEAYGVRPSAVLGIEDEWLAFQLDELALMTGREIEREHDGSQNGRFRVADRRKTQAFAPMKMPGITKMMIPENGIW